MFRIKICGITSVDDALLVARAGADAVGLNFYPRSPRYISLDTARKIVAALPKEIVKVGLFVNAPPADVCRTYSDLSLDLIQLHGDEPPEYLAQLGGRPVMRAFRVLARRPPLGHRVSCPLPRVAGGAQTDIARFAGSGGIRRNRKNSGLEHRAAVRRPVRAAAAGSGRRTNARQCRRGDCRGSTRRSRCGQRGGVKSRSEGSGGSRGVRSSGQGGL